MMSKHEWKYCPGCNSRFECKPGNITQCHCNDIKLSEAERAFIAIQYDDCLCHNCLLELRGEYAAKDINLQKDVN